MGKGISYSFGQGLGILLSIFCLVSLITFCHCIWFHCKWSFSTIVKTGQRRVDPSAVIFIRQKQNQTGNGQQAITGISEQRRKQ